MTSITASAARQVLAESGVGTAGFANLEDLAALANLLPRTVLPLARNPLASDIDAGTARVTKNTVTGRISLWVNDGGTMIDLLAFATA